MSTRTHTAVGCGVMGLALLAVPAVAVQTYPTNAWPTWEHTRAGRIWASCVYSGALERYYACRASDLLDDPDLPAAPSWWSSLWRSGRSDLVDYKELYAEMIPCFLDTDVTGAGASLTNYLSGPDYTHKAALPLLTVTGLLLRLAMPTNYLTYTPQRCLSGLGPPGYTSGVDYVATGRAYGWTNASTAAGGAVPTNREAWRTTDYGWAGLTNIAAALTHTLLANETWGYPGSYTSAWDGSVLWYENVTTWTGAQGEAEARWATNHFTPLYEILPRAVSEGAYDADPYDAGYSASVNAEYAHRAGSGRAYPDTPTFSLDRYAYCEFPRYTFKIFGVTNYTYTWDSNGETLLPNQWAYVAEELFFCSETNGAVTYYSQPIGTTNGTLPTWCDEPTTNIPGEDVRWRGWYLGNDNSEDADDSNHVMCVMDWITPTNGFQWR